MYKLQYHPTLAARWQSFGRTEQIFMIGNELNRAMNAAKDNDAANTKSAIERAFELIDLMVECTTGSRRHELLRLRELLAECYQFPEKATPGNLRRLCYALLLFDSKAFMALGANYQ